MRRLFVGTALAALATAIAIVGGWSSTAGAQTPVPTFPAGVVSGTVANGTAGAGGTEGVRLQLLALAKDGRVTATETSAEGGRFSFSPPADPTVTYVLRATYQGVSYLVDPPILLSAELVSDQREITVFETTDVPPELRIESTVMSVQGLDRERGELSLQREDQVVNPSDRVYVGAADRVTLRIPVPDGVTGLALTDEIEATVRLDGPVATTTQALRPGSNLVVTRYVVGYDLASDRYRLRVTSPLPAAEMEIWVPERFVEDVEAGPGAVRASDRTIQDERWRIVSRIDPAREGESLVATIDGLTRANESNPLTQRAGAAAGATIAIAVLLGGLLVTRWLPHRRGEAA